MNIHTYISGIQQIGIGVTNIHETMMHYKNVLGMNVLIFNDTSDANLMTKYTGGKVFNRQAVLSMNLAGGGGVEIWQYNNKKPEHPCQEPSYGDLGIYAAKIKCKSTKKTHEYFITQTSLKTSAIQTDPQGKAHFWLHDGLGNKFNFIESKEWFKTSNKNNGGIAGAIIGVKNMEKAIQFYTQILGTTNIVYDVQAVCNDNDLAKATNCRRVLLKKQATGIGAFNKLLGDVEIELVQCLDEERTHIFKNRFWGDCGFIHLCFDVLDMAALNKHLNQHDIHFTVDSNESFAMENAAGRFCYAEDPDGTLIELVETHKIPILKKIGWYLNLKKRNQSKPLPNWMINMLAFSKVK